MHARLTRLDPFAGTIDVPENQKYGPSELTDRGNKGGLHVGYAKEWVSYLAMVLDAFEVLPAAGQGLRDHIFAPLIVMRNPKTNDRNPFYQDEVAMGAALIQWEIDGTGPWPRVSWLPIGDWLIRIRPNNIL
ncbi:hypothetical protein AnigIFM59636_003734 [Aspergillus niger]|nr:hypothetical protein AnigIFM59636_003734 [Aspergillus niger]